MKKPLILLIIFSLFALTSCGESSTSTTSMLKIIVKGHSSDYKEYWIKAYDPNNYTKEEWIKIQINDEMVWNLIEEDREYFTTYSKKGDNPWILEQIEQKEIQE